MSDKSMKLYTEEQVKIAISIADSYRDLLNYDDILPVLTPIQLVSNKDIDKNTPTNPKNDYEIGFMYGWEEGAKWVLEQINNKKDENRN